MTPPVQSRRENPLRIYKDARGSSLTTARDWLASAVANTVLRALASKKYRALMNESIHLGLLELARKGGSQMPFNEPMDDKDDKV